MFAATLFCWFAHSGLSEMFAETYISLTLSINITIILKI